MHVLNRPAAIAAAGAIAATALAASAAFAGTASAATVRGASASYPAGAVFVQTDGLTGNEVVAYQRAADGALTLAGSYSTGGLGGQLDGSVVDHLASEGSLAYDPGRRLLYAVNAGSDTVSVFAVHGTALTLRQVTGSGGTFPVSIAVRGDLVYVLNAENGGSLQGYREYGGRLHPLPGSARNLGLNPGATPQYTNTPGQALFSPDGSQLIVTTKANGSDIDVYGVQPGGRLSASPVVNSEPGLVPFAGVFDPDGQLVIADAGTNAVTSFRLARSGSLTTLSSVPTGEQSTCWVAQDGSLEFVSNAGSGIVSSVQASSGGQLALLGQTSTDPGTVDAAVAPGGQYLYVQTGGNGVVDEFAIGNGGSLASIGSVTVSGAAGGEGIVAAGSAPPRG